MQLKIGYLKRSTKLTRLRGENMQITKIRLESGNIPISGKQT